VIRLAWAGGPVVKQGRYFNAAENESRPVPSPAPPIWVGGGSDKAAERAARWGDAWVPVYFPAIESNRVISGANAGTLDELSAKMARVRELRDALGRPQTILCLGNGPSSEDPALAGHADACLFRVNHRWLARGLYSRPQMVFTGQKRTLFEVRSKPIFAFQTCRAEALLVTHQIFNPLCRFMRFVTLERLGILTGPDWDGVRPTNGATMLATAVALNPPRIVIAGIDLFADPAGAYPGDAQTSNDYVVVHERSIEIDFILKTLKSYGGELLILGKPLAEKWAAAQLAAGT